MVVFVSGGLFLPNKPSEEELEFYKECYKNVCAQKTLFYQVMNNGQNKEEMECAACNFLLYLNLFNVNVPKKIRKKEFEDFEETKDLAKIIMNEYLNRSRVKV